MKFFNKFIILGMIAFSTLMLNMRANALSEYGLSCTNDLYGTQHGGIYIAAGNIANYVTTVSYGVYTGTDCVYAGGGRTNSSAIVGGEIARSAANAIIGAVNNRLSSAMSMNSDTAAHMSYSTNGNGIGMAANHLVGGMSLWTNFSSSNFENDQTYSSAIIDSNAYEGDASTFSFGIDKKFGNLLIGLNWSSFDSDIDTKVNDGNIKTEGETYGIYAGLNTGPLMISFGGGVGDYDIETDRVDLGNNTRIKASGVSADVTYYHASVSGAISRGKLSFAPRVNYRSFEIDIPTFTDVVPNDSNTMDTAEDSNVPQFTTADETVAGKAYSSDQTEVGLNLSLATGTKLIPFIDVAYVNESTTAAEYRTELADDGQTDLNASNADGYMTYGGGLSLNAGKMMGFISIMETVSRDDFTETVVSGSLRLRF